jgi:hypothetical protein
MKAYKQFRLGRGFLSFAAIAVTSITCLVSSSEAAVYNLTDNNSTAMVDPTSQSGMFHWDIQGQNQLQQQWFWYGLDGVAVHSIDTISAPTVVTTGTRELTATYLTAGSFSVAIDYLLTGGPVVAVGSTAVSDIGETIKISNLSQSPLVFHFYQYSYFNLNGASLDTVQLGKNPRGLYNDALQQNATAGLTETVTTPGANEGEVNTVGATLAKLNGGAPVTLGAPYGAGPLGPGAVTWALEWDLSIAAGGSAIISKDKSLQITIVPEPSTLAVLGLGAAALCGWRRRAAV